MLSELFETLNFNKKIYSIFKITFEIAFNSFKVFLFKKMYKMRKIGKIRIT